ncbi:hypothetical protein DVH24_009922 [Malus domestica]|uniref:Uncharacterized protein n=1 Tax=Malus domestica TaxID=3750 RepID=A0A498JRQ2_MALDO|nr:hypothetical protein DVH24_009922 [Malus domestica]
MEIESEMKQQSKFRRICVFCESSQGKKSNYQDVAIELGKELMLNLISNRQTASKVSQTPTPASNAATSPLDMGKTGVPPAMPIGPTVSTAPASSTSSVTHSVLSAR